MTLYRTLAAVGIVFVVLAMGTDVRPAHGAEEQSGTVPRPGSRLAMSKFYTGPTEKIGRFPGKLICLRCDLTPSQLDEKMCREEGHRHALSMEEDSMVHPLAAGTAELLEEINSEALHGKAVVVSGKYYPATGVIVVGSIEAR